jgi:hypothetical protein
MYFVNDTSEWNIILRYTQYLFAQLRESGVVRRYDPGFGLAPVTKIDNLTLALQSGHMVVRCAPSNSSNSG